MTTRVCFRSVRPYSETERLASLRLARREGYEGHAFRLHVASGQTSITDFGNCQIGLDDCRLWLANLGDGNPFAQRHHTQLRRRVRAVWSATTLQLKHLRHLRWQVSCATHVRRRRWCRCSRNECPRHRRQALRSACALQVHRRSTVVSMLWTSVRGIGANVRARRGLP